MPVVFLISGVSYTVPADFTAVNTIEGIGAGAHGLTSVGSSGVDGGGGGAYAKITNQSLTPGGSVSYVIGAGNSGTNTNFNSGALVAQAASGATGGTAASSTGSTKFDGGNGGAGGGNTGGGGGGAAGLNGAGVAGSAGNGSGGAGGNGDNGSGGSGGASATSGGNGTEWDATHGSGGGGGGGTFSADGGNGGRYGAGGGGAPKAIKVNGTGYQGLIVITYTAATFTGSVLMSVGAALLAAVAAPWPYQFMGAAQPYGQKQLNPSIIAVQADNPPFNHSERTTAQARNIAQASQPDPWVYNTLGSGGLGPYLPTRMPAAILGIQVNNPPFAHPGRNPLVNIVQQWQPDPWVYNYVGAFSGLQPYGPSQLNPSISAVPEDNPPFSHRERIPLANIPITATQPDPWTYSFFGGLGPFVPSKLNPTVTDVQVDAPPFRHPARTPGANITIDSWQPPIWPYVHTGGQGQFYDQRRLTPSIHGVVRDDPQFTHPMRRPAYMALNTPWQPDPWVFTYAGPQGGTQPYGKRNLPPFVTDVEVNDPPFGIPNKPTLSVVADTWKDDPWPPVFMGNRQAYQGRQVSPAIPGQSIDEPPYRNPGRIPAQMAVVNQQQPDPWTYTFMGGAGPFMPSPSDPEQPGVSVNNPPFRHPARTPGAMIPLSQWQPEVWPYTFMGGLEPYIGKHLPPSIIAVPIIINYRLTVRNVIVRTRIVSSNPWPGPTYPPNKNS